MRRSYSGFSLFAIKSIYFMKNNIIYGKSPYSTLNPIDLYPLLALTKQKTECPDVFQILLKLRRKDEFTYLNPKTKQKSIYIPLSESEP